MAYENVQFPQANFCIAPRTDEFCSINYATDVMQIKTSAGALQQTYTLDTNVDEIRSIEYVGPRNLSLSYSQLGTELPFFTLEHIDSTQCKIRRWKLNNTGNTLDLQSTITLTTSGSNYFDCYDMAIEHYETSFASATTTGTGQISLDSANNIEVGDILLLGPSGDVDNLYAFEYVEVTNVVGNTVYITTDGTVPPTNEYVEDDPVTFWKYAHIFSDLGQDNDNTKGSLYKIDLNNGAVSGVDDSGIYSEVRASAWSRAYSAVGFVQDVNILYINSDTYQIQKSQVLTNIDDDNVTVLTIYDLVFDDVAIYRLQAKITLVDDDGNKSTTTWGTYNYHQDTISPYTKSITLYTVPDGVILSDESIAIKAVVRDQFGVGLSSKLVYFFDSPDRGYFTPLNGQATTNANGVASMIYTTDYFNPESVGTDSDDVVISVRTDGASTYTGSQYVWDGLDLLVCKKFTMSLGTGNGDGGGIIQKPTLSGTWPTEGSDLYSQAFLNQIADLETDAYLKSLSRFQFPGGHWAGGYPPSDNTTTVVQLASVEIDSHLEQISDIEIDMYLNQKKQQTNELQLSQLYISRHHSSGHKDDVDIDQFTFIEDAVPAFWSEKNPVNTNIWIRLRPFAFSLNQSSLIFRVREVSYAGDTGYVDVTSLCTVTTFDAGGGLLGLDVLCNPANDFHHNAVVYVSIEVYDNAPTPNVILTDYWFKIIPDYRAPYIENESPSREEEDVAVNTNISFDVLDAGVGVDIDSLELYVNNRYKVPTVTTISGGYHVVYDPAADFYYSQTVEITVKVRDASNNQNQLHDMWRFYCEGSTGPWIDPDSFYPRNCARGVYRKILGISANVYAINDTGVDPDSILVRIGGKYRNVTKIPIIYRID